MLAALCAVGLPLMTAVDATAARTAGPATGPVHLPVPVSMPVSMDRLTVRVDDGAEHVTTYELACHPAGGTHPDVRAACDRLDALGGPVGPATYGQLCTMIYGGPQTATVVGTWRGAPVDERYDRANGCETARWNDMAPVLPAPALVEDGGRDVRGSTE
jgi:hypothetical protein